MARAMWKGSIELGSQSVPVKLYAAAQDAAVRFHLIDTRTKSRVSQRWVDPNTGHEVARTEIKKGFATRPDAFVFLDDDELRALDPEPSRAIEVTHAVAIGDLSPAWFERPYYLGPDGDNASYAALVNVMQRRARDVLVHWVMRRKRYNGLIHALDDRLLLFTLHAHDELVAPPKLKIDDNFDDKELALAEQLISALQGDFDPSALTSDYDERVRDFLAQKAKGKRVVLRHAAQPAAPHGPLERILKKSVDAVARRSPARPPKQQPAEKKSA